MQTPTCFMDDPNNSIGQHRSLCVLANAFPVFPLHLLLVPGEHREALLREDLASALDFVHRFPDYLVFHNMRTAGASRPDHLHFQAVPRNDQLPLLVAPRRELSTSFDSGQTRVFAIDDYPAYVLLIQGPGEVDMTLSILQLLGGRSFNLLLTNSGVFVIPRTKERPEGFTSQFAALEMAGCLVTAATAATDRHRSGGAAYPIVCTSTWSLGSGIATFLVNRGLRRGEHVPHSSLFRYST